MAALHDVYFKKETLEIILKTMNAKQAKGISLTFSINDETNEYGQNVSAFVSQSKEERDAKKPKYYVGNGKVFWENGKILKAEPKKEKAAAPEQKEPEWLSAGPDNLDDLPF